MNAIISAARRDMIGGTLYIRHREQVEAVKRVGPLKVLATTAFAD